MASVRLVIDHGLPVLDASWIKIPEVEQGEFDLIVKKNPEAIGVPAIRHRREVWPAPSQGWSVKWADGVAFAVPDGKRSA